MTTAPEPIADLVERFGRADEIEISTRRPDGSLRGFVPIWVVAVDGALYVRSYRGAAGAWYRHATTHSAEVGAIRTTGEEADVAFSPVDPRDARLLDAISEAYRAKYARYGDRYLQPMLADEAAATTLRLDKLHHR